MNDDLLSDCPSLTPAQESPETGWTATKSHLITRDAVAGVCVSAAPTVVFAVVNYVAPLAVGIAAAGVTAAVTLIYRAVRRESLIGALVGAAVVAGCVTVAALTHQARGFFLLPTVAPFVIIVVGVATVAARRPLSGLILNRVVGGPRDWHRHDELRRVYTISTMAFVVVNTVNAALQVPLYLYGETSILAISHVVTQPVFVVIVAATVVFARRTIIRGGGPNDGLNPPLDPRSRPMTEMTISTDADLITVISAFTVQPTRQAELLALLERNAATLLTQLEGFVGASLHVSVDGSRIINYAQWVDLAALHAMLADPLMRQHQSDVAALAAVEPVRCIVRSVHRPRSDDLALRRR